MTPIPFRGRRAHLKNVNDPNPVPAMVFVVTATLAWQTLRTPLTLVIAAAAGAVLALTRVNATWVMLAAAAIGLARGVS